MTIIQTCLGGIIETDWGWGGVGYKNQKGNRKRVRENQKGQGS